MSSAPPGPGHGAPPPGHGAAPSPSTVRRRRAVALALLAALLGLIVGLAAPSGGGHRQPAAKRTGAGAAERAPSRFKIHALALKLPAALQFPAAAPLAGQQFVVLGGLEAGESSTAAVTVLEAGRLVSRANLPEPQHDAPAARLGAMVYVFGGGQENSYDHILRFDPATTSVTQAGTLPQATSDAAVAVVGETAYVIGGYNGQQALDTIVAWRPGASAEVVGHLPSGLRYAAAATAGGKIVIAGGTPGEGASSAILRFDPATRQTQAIGVLPAATQHTSAFGLGRYAYVVGGRGAGPGSETAAIVAIDSSTGATTSVGTLPQALSDAAVVVGSGRVWVVGGAGASGPLDSIVELDPVGP